MRLSRDWIVERAWTLCLLTKLDEGLVYLSIKVDRSGCATEVAVAGSSGAEEFDAAALKAVDATMPLPVAFRLQ